MRSAGKTVIITGAASGIGKATCLLFASEGATVIAGDIDQAGGEELAATSNGKIFFKRGDKGKEVAHLAELGYDIAKQETTLSGLSAFFAARLVKLAPSFRSEMAALFGDSSGARPGF